MKRSATLALAASTALAAAGSVALSGPASAATSPAAPAAASAAPSATTDHSCTLPTYGAGSAYRPDLRGLRLRPHVDNPWFPLRPGTTLVFQGSKDGKRAVDVFVVSHHTKTVYGVRTRVVEDRLYLNGVLEEKTTDYYSQDRCGNVWYLGEDTATLDSRGRVTDREGTWHAGTSKAQPGVYVQADPQLGRRFRQEWAPGQAEDTYRALRRGETVTVPAGRYSGTLRTEETTSLEPGAVDNKLYARGVGTVVEMSVRGGAEVLKLVDVLR